MELAVDVLPRLLLESEAGLCSDIASYDSANCSLSAEEVRVLLLLVYSVVLGLRAIYLKHKVLLEIRVLSLEYTSC